MQQDSQAPQKHEKPDGFPGDIKHGTHMTKHGGGGKGTVIELKLAHRSLGSPLDLSGERKQDERRT